MVAVLVRVNDDVNLVEGHIDLVDLVWKGLELVEEELEDLGVSQDLAEVVVLRKEGAASGGFADAFLHCFCRLYYKGKIGVAAGWPK